ncbi:MULTISPECIES: hypothetical protein [Bacillus]|nr:MULTISPECIES: hypothetical protein [Bacillus]
MSLNAIHRSIMIYSDTEEKAINKLESTVAVAAGVIWGGLFQ